MCVIASVVAENTVRVIEYQDLRPDMIEKQIDAVFEDIPPDAVKIGMLSNRGIMLAAAKKIRQYQMRNIVLDPVMYAKNGAPLMDPESIDTLISELAPLVDLITPNIPEAEKIAEMSIAGEEDMKEALRRIHALGCGAALIKGGHSIGEATDILFDGKEFYYYSAPRIVTKNTHGTGCTFSSAIAANLALGAPLQKALELAKTYITGAIAHAPGLGRGSGPTHHFYELYRSGLNNTISLYEEKQYE
jgi:hydroxymethylpyrimidine/phosphomethylpyrimidine kinase